MSLVSIITAVYGEASASHLSETYESVRDQQLPDGWEWEWIIQEDDVAGVARPYVPEDERVHYATGRHGGPGVARTMGLARSRGDLIKCLDADDLLTEGALARDLEALTDPEVGWSVCRALDLMPDGTTRSYVLGDPPAGEIAQGEVLAQWRSAEQKALMVLPGTVCMRRDLAVALGGWMALPASEDTGLIIAANALMKGFFIETPGLMYRKWSGQVTAQAAHVDEIERSLRNRLIAERGDAVARIANARQDRVGQA